MTKNKLGKKIIRKLNKLSRREKTSVLKAALAMGFLVLLIYFLTLFLLDWYPNKSVRSFDAGVTWTLIASAAIALFVLGIQLGMKLQLMALGYAYLPLQFRFGAYQSRLQAFSDSSTTTRHQSYSPSSSMSINPGSGLPMCGSSGIDSRGNPFGSSSWRS